MEDSNLNMIVGVLAGGMADIREELNRINRTLERWEDRAVDDTESLKSINQRIQQFMREGKSE